MLRVFIFLILVLSCPANAQAYFDPGSGGYFISSVLAAIGAFFALASAFVIHFFRNILWRNLRLLWNRFPFLVVAGVLVLVVAIGAFLFHLFYEPSLLKFDAARSGAHILDADKVYPGYSLYEGRLIDKKGKLVKKWSRIYLGVIDPLTGDYYAQKYYEAPLWGRYTW
ncbi:MAG: hypothetical protein HQL15_09295, partial [Candidatus Omnitrophica bacterium]|nr:hypothetical protein [Candidatus Omnitrophota bacterium]